MDKKVSPRLSNVEEEQILPHQNAVANPFQQFFYQVVITFACVSYDGRRYEFKQQKAGYNILGVLFNITRLHSRVQPSLHMSNTLAPQLFTRIGEMIDRRYVAFKRFLHNVITASTLSCIHKNILKGIKRFVSLLGIAVFHEIFYAIT